LQTNLRRPASQTDARAGKYLTFQLSKEEFGIRVLKVREIMGLQEITAVPQTPMHIKGVINLRGKVVPVIDLRLKFGLEAAEYTQRTCIIVTQVQGESGFHFDGDRGGRRLGGPQPDRAGDRRHAGLRRGRCRRYLLGMAKVKGKVKILLDIDRVLSSQDLHGLTAILILGSFHETRKTKQSRKLPKLTGGRRRHVAFRASLLALHAAIECGWLEPENGAAWELHGRGTKSADLARRASTGCQRASRAASALYVQAASLSQSGKGNESSEELMPVAHSTELRRQIDDLALQLVVAEPGEAAADARAWIPDLTEHPRAAP
jgi:purine-binding chemotaxis protein CheW